MKEGVWWVGQDGKSYYKDAGGTGLYRDRGTHYTQIEDPVNPANTASEKAKRFVANSLYHLAGVPEYDYDATNTPPNPPDNRYSGGGYSSYNAQEAKNKADAVARYDEEINDANFAKGIADREERVGIDNANSSYNQQMGELNSSFKRGQNDYNSNVRETKGNYRDSTAQVQDQARDTTRNVQRLLGAGGAGDSSFSKILAPFLIAKGATRSQDALQKSYAKNMQGLDTNWQNLKDTFEKNKKKLEDDKVNRIREIQRHATNTRADLEAKIRNAQVAKSTANGSSLANALSSSQATKNAIRDYQNKASDLSRKTYSNLASMDWKKPTLESYNKDIKQQEVKGQDGDAAGLADQLDPNYTSLLDPERKKREAGVY